MADAFLLNDKNKELAEYHISSGAAPYELSMCDYIVNKLPKPLAFRPSDGDEFYNKEIMEIIQWDISSEDYNEISFSAVFGLWPESDYPRYGYMTGGCDYTGWGCQSGASIIFADSLMELYRYGLDEEDRKKWSIDA